MKLIEKESCYLIEGAYDPSIIVGFTKPNLKGVIPGDIDKFLSFLKSDFKVAHLTQPHTAIVNIATDAGTYEGDGIFTKEKAIVLVAKTADCLPLFFANDQLVGVIHMGWKSAKAGILDNLDFDLSTSKVVAGLGMRMCCYRVGKEFLKDEDIRPSVIKDSNELHFDVIDYAKRKLLARGLPESNFLDLDYCSACSSKMFPSYRRDATADRTLSFIVRK